MMVVTGATTCPGAIPSTTMAAAMAAAAQTVATNSSGWAPARTIRSLGGTRGKAVPVSWSVHFETFDLIFSCTFFKTVFSSIFSLYISKPKKIYFFFSLRTFSTATPPSISLLLVTFICFISTESFRSTFIKRQRFAGTYTVHYFTYMNIRWLYNSLVLKKVPIYCHCIV